MVDALVEGKSQSDSLNASFFIYSVFFWLSNDTGFCGQSIDMEQITEQSLLTKYGNGIGIYKKLANFTCSV